MLGCYRTDVRTMKLSVVSCLFAALLFVVFGGWVFGPLMDDVAARHKVTSFLKGCPTDEIREIRCLGLSGQYVVFTANLTRGTWVQTTWDDPPAYWGLFWSRHPLPRARFSMDTLFDGAPYNRTQIVEISEALLKVPPPQSSTKSDFNDQLHLAFWQENQLCNYDYTRDDARKAFSVLSTKLAYPMGDL